jgi:uncharacterized membrane protein
MNIRALALCAAVAARYAGLTAALGSLGFGPLQFRPAEALALLPFLVPCTMWGLFVGCAAANLLGGFGLIDVVFGSLATLLAGFLTSKCKTLPAAVVPPVVINAAVVGAVLVVAAPGLVLSAWPAAALSVGLSQVFSVGLLGVPLTLALKKPLLSARWGVSAR